jgi:hypothetical protein
MRAMSEGLFVDPGIPVLLNVTADIAPFAFIGASLLVETSQQWSIAIICTDMNCLVMRETLRGSAFMPRSAIIIPEGKYMIISSAHIFANIRMPFMCRRTRTPRGRTPMLHPERRHMSRRSRESSLERDIANLLPEGNAPLN